MMQISVIGTGYVGAVTGACLSELGNSIIFVGRNQKKLDVIKSGKSPIYEPGLDHLFTKNRQKITTTVNISDAIKNSQICFICVGTPSQQDGSIDLNQIVAASRTIGKTLASDDQYHTIVIKSTVLPGTTERIVIPILEKESGKDSPNDFGVASNPEFLREGSAVDDFFNADRIVIGTNNRRTGEDLAQLYSPLNLPLFMTTIRTSEMIKYASNAFLATKISFANEIGNLCKELNIDSYEVFRGVGLDKRINPHFFRSGIGFGGSCFPKDVKALRSLSRELGIDTHILDAVMKVNDTQPGKMIEILKRHLHISGKTIGILGLAFKPDTDDVRESRAIPLIKNLLEEGARIIAFDPAATENFKPLFPAIQYAQRAEEVLLADAVLIVTEWKEFDELDYHGKIVIDGRRLGNACAGADVYEGVCW